MAHQVPLVVFDADKIKTVVRPLALLLASVAILAAQSPVKIDYTCSDEDVDAFGLTCSPDDPCPVFLELAAVEAVGAKLFLTGNLHTAVTTLYGLLLVSEDAGKTWTEPAPRQRGTALDQIQFLDFANGWISGQHIDPLPRDSFFMLTTDGGKSWRAHPVFDDTRVGSVAQFWFDSRNTGELIFDASQGAAIRQELYETLTGGESWTVKEVGNKALRLAKARLRENPTWRFRADAPSKTYRLERRTADNKWELIASFLINIAACQ
jgi:hypothetical protein